MADVRPFPALRPANELAAQVIAPPYDVLTEAEARALAGDPRCFLRVTRPEVDLPEGTDSHSDAAYAKARERLDAFISEGTMVQDAEPSYYFYGQVMDGRRQVGIMAGCSVQEYDQGLIKKHEFTRPDKEDDRTHHMSVLEAQVGLVFLAYRATEALDALTARVIAGEPEWSVTTEDGVQHTLWVAPAELVAPIRQAFAQVPALYVADVHHRSAAASRYRAAHPDSERAAHFLAGVFPDDQLFVMAYNRIVHDLNGHTPEALLAAVGQKYAITEGVDPVPTERGTATMYLGGTWYGLAPREGVVDHGDPVACLDVAVLQDNILGPLLGVDDPRRSTRITFAGGIRGPEYLSDAVDEGWGAVAFHMYPTGMDQLFRVADAGEVMPPKSTWFEPKLRAGVVALLLR